MENPYLFLNLDPECTDGELEARYNELKMQYSEDRYLEGDAGRVGAENLTRLEDCYSEIKTRRAGASTSVGDDGDLDAVDRLIKDGALDSAQAALDKMGTRNGRWHYLEAIIYYKRSWFTESLRQLDIALSLEPDNTQYRHSKEMMEQTINGTLNGAKGAQGAPNPGAQPGQGQGAYGAPQSGAAPQPDDAMGMATCCQTLCCMDCLCNTLRCVGCG